MNLALSFPEITGQAWALIVTLSSIPPRFVHLRPTLDSLLRQKHRAERIVLYIPQSYRRFPDWNGELPIVPNGVEIRRVDEDFGPATKVLPAVREFDGKDIDILFCDDDVAYDRGWTSRFAALRHSIPSACIVEAGKDIDGVTHVRLPRVSRKKRAPLDRLFRRSRYAESGYCDTLMGVGGALVKPGFFTSVVFDIPELLWTVDDIWLSGHLELNGIPIWVNAEAPRRRERRQSKKIAALKTTVHAGKSRDESNRVAIEYFRNRGIWL